MSFLKILQNIGNVSETPQCKELAKQRWCLLFVTSVYWLVRTFVVVKDFAKHRECLCDLRLLACVADELINPWV